MKVTQKPITTSKMNAGKNEQQIKVVPTLFKTLINNQACVTSAVKFPWWVAVLFFIFSIAISFIPSVTNAATTKGNFPIATVLNGTDLGFEDFTRKLNGEEYDEVTGLRTYNPEKEVNLVVKPNANGENELVFEDEKSKTNWDAMTVKTTYADSTYNYYEYVQDTGNKDKDGNVIKAAKLRVFIVLGETGNNISLPYQTFYNNPIFGISKGLKTDDVNYKKPASLLVLGSKEFYYATYSTASTANNSITAGPIRGDYLHLEMMPEGGLFLKNLTKDDKGNFVTLRQSKWNEFFDEGYSTARSKSTLYSWILTFGLNSILTIIFGSTLWLMTRGKNNPNRHFKYWETLKISFYTALAPALLTLIIGFIWPKMASFAFVAFMSIRLMWLSMKTLRPM